jgi:hypothetical protein
MLAQAPQLAAQHTVKCSAMQLQGETSCSFCYSESLWTALAMYSVCVHAATVDAVHAQHGSECWKMISRNVIRLMK